MELPLVSILIPTYNRPNTLKIALDSALEQTYPNIEIVISDDSTDNRTQDMLAHYLALYPKKIKYHKSPQESFLDNWCKCFELATGEYINYLMDDDIFHKEKIEKMIYFFNEFENIKLVTSYRQTIDVDGNFLRPIRATAKLFDETRIMDGKALGDIALSSCLNIIGEPTTVLFRKKDIDNPFRAYKGKQYKLISDLTTWLSLLSKGKAVYMPESLSYFRLHPDQIKLKDNKVFSEWLDVMIASREDGFLSTNELFKAALNSYRQRVEGYPQFTDDIKRIETILSTL